MDWVITPLGGMVFFCRHCGRSEYRHAEGHCLFETTTFAYESHATIVKRRVEDQFLYQPATKDTAEQMAAYAKQLFATLARSNIPP